MKKITREELDQILQQHELWLTSSGTNGDRFYSRPPDPPEPKDNRGTYLTIIVVLGSVVGGSLLLGSLLLGRYAVKRYRAAVAAKLELERSNKSRVQTAVKQVQTLLYPFCVTKY